MIKIFCDVKNCQLLIKKYKMLKIDSRLFLKKSKKCHLMKKFAFQILKLSKIISEKDF